MTSSIDAPRASRRHHSLPRALAGRYSRALLDVATQLAARGELKLADLAVELRQCVALLEGSQDLEHALFSPRVPLERKQALLDGVLAAAGASDLLRRLLAVLLGGERLALLGAVAQAFERLVEAREGRVVVEAVSAQPLERPQVTAMTAALSAHSGLQVQLRESVDPALLGGVIIRMNGITYDGSARTRLRLLREHLHRQPAGQATTAVGADHQQG